MARPVHLFTRLIPEHVQLDRAQRHRETNRRLLFRELSRHHHRRQLAVNDLPGCLHSGSGSGHVVPGPHGTETKPHTWRPSNNGRLRD